MEIVIVVLAMAVGAFIKGVTGSGLPVLAIPVMATFIGVEDAVVIMAIPGVVTNTWLIWEHRAFFRETRDLPVLLATGTTGVVAGVILLRTLDERILSLVLAGIVTVYVATFLLRTDFHLSPGVTRFTAPPVGLVGGVLQGATGISGPLITAYAHAHRLPQRAYVLQVVTMFQVQALVQVIALAVLGLYTARRLGLSLLALVPIMSALPFGSRLSRSLSRRAFDLAVLGLLLLFAGKLVYDAATGGS